MKTMETAAAVAQIMMGVLASAAFVYMMISQRAMNRRDRERHEKMKLDSEALRKRIAELPGGVREVTGGQPSAQA
jgi:hypothetical protein